MTPRSTSQPPSPLEALEEHEPRLRARLLARLGNREEVDEVMQEVAVAAAQQAQRPEPVRDVGAWLYQVAMRQMMQLRRKAGRRRKLAQRAAAWAESQEFGAENDPLRFLLAAERQEKVRNALEQLDPRDQQSLMLKYAEGLSYGQIAERLGMTPSAVQSRLHRARRALREVLTKKDESDESTDRSA
ncbi:MAG: hypothetical protein KatS3mg111_4218 [Pirellulaceae bacterium]|nr:MAG: hypothetical protein KatS3mg111_4218 [Pirellulaceae bacterium]